jgi:phosphoglycolate phosphatase-like HAD superfamily hydrolase
MTRTLLVSRVSWIGIAALAGAGAILAQTETDPLLSWHNSKPRQAIEKFVQQTTTPGSPMFVPPADRIAVFDTDGTLWAEQPLYPQYEFMLEQVKAALPKHPEWKDDPVYKALMARDKNALDAIGANRVLGLLAKANSGMTIGQYDKAIRDWQATAKHPKFQRPYTDLVYAPMQELLAYLRANGFRTFLVAGGSVEFVRPWAEKAFGIPPEQIIGSQQEVKFQMTNGRPRLFRGPGIAFVGDGVGKVVGIYRTVGRRPIAAFGNSDGDIQMFQATADEMGARLVMVIHHDDPDREFEYDRMSKVGRLDKALDEASEKGWVVVSMKNDWGRIFAFPTQ